MDEKIEKALATANFVATLSNQKRIILEEYEQNMFYYLNGATFKITPELIAFVKSLVDLGTTTNVVLIDANKLPVTVDDLEKFLESLISTYTDVTNEYASKYDAIKTKRKIADIVGL